MIIFANNLITIKNSRFLNVQILVISNCLISQKNSPVPRWLHTRLNKKALDISNLEHLSILNKFLSSCLKSTSYLKLLTKHVGRITVRSKVQGHDVWEVFLNIAGRSGHDVMERKLSYFQCLNGFQAFC